MSLELCFQLDLSAEMFPSYSALVHGVREMQQPLGCMVQVQSPSRTHYEQREMQECQKQRLSAALNLTVP